VQVVDHVARAEDQLGLVAQRAQALAEQQVTGGRESLVDAELHDGHVRVREHVHEQRPRAVVEAPALVALDGRRREQRRDPRGELGAPGAG
jgi:hypothetical protein